MKKIKVVPCPYSKVYSHKIVIENGRGKRIGTYGYFKSKKQADKTLRDLIKGRKFLRGF